MNSDYSEYLVKVLADDYGQSVGAEICGIPVIGGLADLPELKKEYSLLVVGIPEKHLAGKGPSMADRFRDKGAGKSNLHRNNGL